MGTAETLLGLPRASARPIPFAEDQKDLFWRDGLNAGYAIA